MLGELIRLSWNHLNWIFLSMRVTIGILMHLPEVVYDLAGCERYA